MIYMIKYDIWSFIAIATVPLLHTTRWVGCDRMAKDRKDP
jgi:hypothetical protein